MEKRSGDKRSGPEQFSTTQWSLVLAAGDARNPDADTALTQLFERYWYPVYARVRQTQFGIDDARDLTQGFFLHLLEHRALALARPERGRFRSFLKTALRNFLVNASAHDRALKRGGGAGHLELDFEEGERRFDREPAHRRDPEALFERRWARTVLANALERLRSELEGSPERDRWRRLAKFLTDEPVGPSYREIAAEFGLSESAVAVSVHRLRKRYGEVLREEVARTVGDQVDVDEEVRYLLTVVRS